MVRRMSAQRRAGKLEFIGDMTTAEEEVAEEMRKGCWFVGVEWCSSSVSPQQPIVECVCVCVLWMGEGFGEYAVDLCVISIHLFSILVIFN